MLTRKPEVRPGGRTGDVMTMDQELEMARPVAPEDIQPGEFVSVLHVVWECPPLPWDRPDGSGKPLRVLMLPRNDCAPMQVIDICLPQLLVKTAHGKRRLIDVRKYRLARVPEPFGRRVFEEIEAQRKAEKESEQKTEAGKEDKTGK